jgi:predicted metal-dependent hydrolase
VSGPLLTDPRGRAKVYRPLHPNARRAALEAYLESYRRAEFFEAHELLEPAWMGTADTVEREFYGGLIKLAAAFVHAGRGNRAGVVKNLRGARERLANGRAFQPDPPAPGVDAGTLIDAIDERLAGLARRTGPGRGGDVPPIPLDAR